MTGVGLPRGRGQLPVALAALWLVVAPGCDSAETAGGIPVGLLLSFSGNIAADSLNSERALLLAIETANRAGGISGLPIEVMARDTRSDPSRVLRPAEELRAAGVAVFIGPDTNDLAVQLSGVLRDRTVILPSYRTSDSSIYKPHSWFVMGPPPRRVACELLAQMRADGRGRPLLIADADGYNSALAFQLGLMANLPRVAVATDQLASDASIQAITSADADAYLLAVLPPTAASLLYGLAVLGEMDDPGKWYLSPTLHTPALLANLPEGLLAGARGVATGKTVDESAFVSRFQQRWDDVPLDDAYAFYDAGAVVALAMQRAQHREGAIPSGTDLGKHVVEVTRAAGMPIRWDQLGRGLELLRHGLEVAYIGLSGPLEFDALGAQTTSANTNWWEVGAAGFLTVPSQGDCRPK
jgi:ABC-type branched-subunit amino acid transport system substrate-binding protein